MQSLKNGFNLSGIKPGINVNKMTGGTPEVRSDKSFTLLTFDICYLTFNQSTNGPVDKKFLRPYEKKNTLEHWNI